MAVGLVVSHARGQAFNNDGLITVSSGNLLQISILVSDTGLNTGTINVQDGLLTVGPGSLVNEARGTISLNRTSTATTATLYVFGNLVNQGLLEGIGATLTTISSSETANLTNALDALLDLSNSALTNGKTLSNQGTMRLRNGSTFTNAGTFTNEGSLTLDGASTSATLGRDTLGYPSADGAWTNIGTISVGNQAALYLGGRFSTADIGTISIDSGGKVYISGELNNVGATLSGPIGGRYLLANGRISGGTVLGSALATGGYLSGSLRDLTIDGDLTLTGGVLTFEKESGAGVTVSGSIYITPSAPGTYLVSHLRFNYDTTLTNPVIFLTAEGAYTAATIATTGAANSLTIDAGTTITQQATGSATLALGDYRPTGGTIINNGSISLPTSDISNAANTTNTGSITAQSIFNRVFFTVNATGGQAIGSFSLLNRTGGSISTSSGINYGILTNEGLFNLSGGTFTNEVTYSASMYGTSADFVGTLTNAKGGQISIGGSGLATASLANLGGSIQNEGDITIAGGSLRNQFATFYNFNSSPTVYHGRINNFGNLTLQNGSSLNNDSVFTNEATGRLALVGDNDSVKNSGTFTTRGSVTGMNGSFSNSITGSLVASGGTFKVGTLTNEGTVRFIGDTSPTEFFVAQFSQYGGLTVVDGTLSGTSLTVSGGTLAGSGFINTSVRLASGAHLAAGDSSVATLTFAAGLTLDDGSILDFDLGTTSDLIRLSAGLLTLPTSGRVTLNLTGGDGFTTGNYDLIVGLGPSGLNTGTFSIASAPDGYTYQLSLNDSALVLNVTAAAVPEPSTYGLMVLGGLGLFASHAWRRRQRQVVAEKNKAA